MVLFIQIITPTKLKISLKIWAFILFLLNQLKVKVDRFDLVCSFTKNSQIQRRLRCLETIERRAKIRGSSGIPINRIANTQLYHCVKMRISILKLYLLWKKGKEGNEKERGEWMEREKHFLFLFLFLPKWKKSAPLFFNMHFFSIFFHFISIEYANFICFIFLNNFLPTKYTNTVTFLISPSKQPNK